MKHTGVRANPQDYGAPLCAPDEWQKIVKEHRSRICIVTAPPPALRRVMTLGLGDDVVHRSPDVLEHNPVFVREGLTLDETDREYDRGAKALRNIADAPVRHGVAHSMFHEAYQFPVPIPDDGLHEAMAGTRTGEVCEVPGIYRLNGQCGHTVEQPVPKGRLFPECPSCHKATTWSLISRTS